MGIDHSNPYINTVLPYCVIEVSGKKISQPSESQYVMY